VRPYLENAHHKKAQKKGFCGVVQDVGLEFKPQYHQNKKLFFLEYKT
jgi:hypothetical protein